MRKKVRIMREKKCELLNINSELLDINSQLQGKMSELWDKETHFYVNSVSREKKVRIVWDVYISQFCFSIRIVR